MRVLRLLIFMVVVSGLSVGCFFVNGCSFSDSQKEKAIETGLDIFCQCYEKEGDELKDCVKTALSDAVLQDLEYLSPCLSLDGEERRDCLMDLSIQIIIDRITDQDDDIETEEPLVLF